MPNKIEITPQERAKLSKETLMGWYVKENNVKLKALRIEIGEALRSGARDKIERLKAVIIANTKEELKKQKGLTEAQRTVKAEAFAEKFIKYAKENKNFGDVFFTSRVELGPEKADHQTAGTERERLLTEWINNNPEKLKPVKDSPKHFAMKEIKDIKKKQEAFMLLGLIEKFWGKEKAWAAYESCFMSQSAAKEELYMTHMTGGLGNFDDSFMKKCGAKTERGGNKFYIEKLRKFFNRSKTNGNLGFWYGTREVWWEPEETIGTWRDATFTKTIPFPYEDDDGYFKVDVTGWWAHDEISSFDAGSTVVYTDVGQDFENDIMPKLTPRGNLKIDTGDEFLGGDFSKASILVKKELYGTKGRQPSLDDRDSGVDPDQEQKVLDALKELKEEAPKVYPSAVSKKIVEWFSKHDRKGKWIILDSESIGYFNFLFGREVGGFIYRYNSDHKRIYFLKMQNVAFKGDWADVGYIDIKDGKVNEWHDKEDPELFLKKEIVDKMKDKEVKDELVKARVANSEGSNLDKLQATKGLAYIVLRKSKFSKVVEYNKIKDSYISKLKINLKKFLIENRKFKPELAEDLAKIRAEHVEKIIRDQIEENAALTKAIEENDREKLRIEINSDDEVKVEINDSKKARKWKKWAKRKIEGAKTTASDIAEGTMAKLELKLREWLGPLAPVAVWILDKVFKIGDVFKKMARGGTSLLGGLLSAVFGVKVLKDRLKSKKITEEVIEKLPPKKKKFYKFDKKMYFSENVQLKGKKIVIPSGKGIKPGKEFDVNIKGVRDKITIKPVEEKKSLLGRIFGSRRKEKYRLEDSEIIISKGTTIPKGTVIPKGAKIYKA